MSQEDAGLPFYRKLHWQILGAMLLGICAGSTDYFLGGNFAPKVAWLGELFVKLLRMVIVPLVFTSIVSGVSSVGSGSDVRRLFTKTMGYYVLSSALAIFAGLLMVNLLKPGVGANISGAQVAKVPELSTPSSPRELLLDVVPNNVVQAMSDSKMLAVIFFCILLGLAIASLPEDPRRTMTRLFEAAFQTMMKLTSGVIRFAPLGVFGLITRVVAESGFASFSALGLYMLTIASSLAIHLFITLPMLLIVLGRIKPSIHYRNMAEPMTLAFSTSSSGATLPATLHAVENKVGVSNKISSFVLPMGATVNMDGTALYECAGVLFVAQALGVELAFGQQMVVVLTALLASIGAAAVPSAGLVIIFLVLEAVNLRGPEVDVIVGAMLAIDRPLDMGRTVVNVVSDSCGAAIIARSEGETDVDTVVR